MTARLPARRYDPSPDRARAIREARDWAHGVRSTVSADSLHAGIRAYYASNHGVGMTTEAVEMLEAAKRGDVHCLRGAP